MVSVSPVGAVVGFACKAWDQETRSLAYVGIGESSWTSKVVLPTSAGNVFGWSTEPHIDVHGGNKLQLIFVLILPDGTVVYANWEEATMINLLRTAAIARCE